jgi:hypothetical protein
MQEQHQLVRGIHPQRSAAEVDQPYSYSGSGASALTQSNADDPYGADYEVDMSEDVAEDDPEIVRDMARPMIANNMAAWMSDFQNGPPQVAPA